jgi:murein DD-endopeptidase MepM/ murein hydrolase activator NlpD
VQRGETLYQVSRCNKVPIRALIDANHLEPPYVLQAGQKLVIPHPQTHTVAAGETLYGIARKNGVDVSALVRENGLNPPYNVFVGQTLIMPGKVATAASAPTVQASPREIQQVESLPPQTHPSAAASATLEPAPTTVPMTMPMPTPPPASKIAPAQPKTAETPAETPVPTPSPEKVAAIPSAREAPAKEAPKAETSAEEETPVAIPTGKSRFIWPVKGKVLSEFGSKSGGLFNDGINIAVPAGTDVRAADSGVVVYAGNEIRGFGNLVLIKHPNGWMTAYAHNEQLLVHRGEQVQRGQAIAKSGSTGTVSMPQLHFEIRRGSRAVDPTKYLAQLAG